MMLRTALVLCVLVAVRAAVAVSQFEEEENDRQKRGVFTVPSGSGESGSAVIIDPDDDGFNVDCLQYYDLSSSSVSQDIPPHCITLPPVQDCGCPPLEDVQEAGTLVIIRELNTHVEVRSRYVQVVVEAVVRNPTDNVQTAEFDLEIPRQAFISKFEIEVNGEVFKGVVEEKEKAAKKFNEAKKRGQSAGTVVQKSASMFGTNVSVALQCELTFRLTYEYVAQRIKGQFNIPIKVVPTLPVIVRRLNISIEDPSGIDCLKAENYGKAKFDMKSKYLAKSTYELDRSERDDFVITYDLDQESLAENAGTTLYDSKGFVFVSYALPQSSCYTEGYNPVCPAAGSRRKRQTEVQSSDSIPKCVSFVIDSSGSMLGTRIQQAKEALILILRVLRDFDYATILEFNSRAILLQPLVQVGPNLDEMIAIVMRIVAGGSTNINDALIKGAQSLGGAVQSEINCILQLVFLTDGQASSGVTDSKTIISNYNREVEKLRQLTGKSVYTYTLAVGTSLDSSLLQTLAVDNRGFFRFINEAESVSSQLTEFYREIACPLLCGATLNYDQGNLANVTKSNFSECYFDGQQVVIGGQYNPDTITKSEDEILKTIVLSGEGAKGETEYSTQLIKIEGENSFVERAYAYLRIQDLIAAKAAGGLSKEAKAEIDASILHLALEYQLVTPLTSIIVVKPCPAPLPRSARSTHTNDTNATASPATTPPTATPTPTSAPPATPTTRMDFDPHFVATSAAGHRLCYTVDGRDGEVYNILSDQAISVNGEIISFRYKGTRKTYFGTIVVKFTPPDCSDDEVTFVIDSDKGLAFLNEDMLMKWGKARVYEHKYATIVSESKKQLQFVLSFPRYNIEIVISRFVRKGSFLGMAITNTAGLSPRAHGLIGQFVVMDTNVTSDDGMLQVRDKWYKVVPWQRLDPANGKYVPCYAVRPKGNAILEGVIPDYLIENLYADEFKFGRYSKVCSKEQV